MTYTVLGSWFQSNKSSADTAPKVHREKKSVWRRFIQIFSFGTKRCFCEKRAKEKSRPKRIELKAQILKLIKMEDGEKLKKQREIENEKVRKKLEKDEK